MTEWTVSLEFIDNRWTMCPLGDYPDGFERAPRFDDHDDAVWWLYRWAQQRGLALTALGVKGDQWRVSPFPVRRATVTGYEPLVGTDDGGADLALVAVGTDGKPTCRQHGAMNKVSPSPPGIWRCITTSSPRGNACRAACVEKETTDE